MEEKIGEVEHYFTDIGVGVISLEGNLKLGDKVHFKGATTDFKQKIESMELDHEKIEEGKKGQEIGVKVKKRVREGDKVLKVK